MKHRILPAALVLALLLLPGVQAAPVASISLEVDYAGRYVAFEDHNFQLYLPEDWAVQPVSASVWHIAPPQGDLSLRLTILQNSAGYTMDSLLAEFEADSAVAEAAPVFFGGAPFVWHLSPGADAFGGVTLSADGAFLYFFTFSPCADEAFQALAVRMLSTLAPAG